MLYFTFSQIQEQLILIGQNGLIHVLVWMVVLDIATGLDFYEGYLNMIVTNGNLSYKNKDGSTIQIPLNGTNPNGAYIDFIGNLPSRVRAFDSSTLQEVRVTTEVIQPNTIVEVTLIASDV